MNIRFHFHDTNGNACCKVQDMSTMAYVHLYCTSGYDLQAYETTFTNHTGGSDTNVFQISTPMAQLDGTTYSVQLYEDNDIVIPYVVYYNNDGIAYVSFDTVSSDVSFTLRINNIGNSDYMLDEPYINPDAQFITPTYTGFNLMAQSLGTDYDNIQNNTQNQQMYSTYGTIVYVQTVTNIVLTVQANEGTPYKVNIDNNIYYLDSNNQVTVQVAGYFQLNGVYDANDAKYLRVDASYFQPCDDYNMPISSDTTITVNDLTSAGHTHYSPNYDMPVSGTWTDGNNTLQTWTGDNGIEYNGNYYNCNYDTSTDSMYYIESEGCDYADGIISDTFVYDSTNDEWTYDGNTFTRVQPVYENTVIFTGATVSQVDIYADNGEGYVTFNVVNNTIQFDDGDYWMMKNLRTTSGTVSAVTSTDPNGDTLSNSITNPNATLLSLNEIPGTWTIDIDAEFPYDIPNLTGRRFGNAENFESWYFTTQNVIHYQNGCDAGATSLDLNITAWIWDLNAWPGVGWTMQTDGNVEYYYDPAEDKFYDNYADYYPEISYDPCVGPTPTQYSIYTSVIGQGSISGNDSPYYEGDTATLTAVPASGWTFDYWTDGDSYQEYYDNPLELTMNSDRNIAVRFRNTPPPVETYTVTVNITGQGTTTGAGDYEEGDQVTLIASPSTGWEFNSWQINGTVVETNSTYQFTMGNQDVTITAVFEEEVEKHIYLCDNSGAHLAEMTKTGSTWNATGSFTSGMYSIRATVEGEYEDAWFKFYQTSGDNRVFVGAGDDPSFEDIGTYIVIEDILTSFSLAEDQTTGYYVVNYQNTEAMTVSMVDNIVNSYIGDFVTASDIAEMGYTTVADISSMSYITMTDIESCGYIDQTSLSSMSYITMTDVQGLGYIDQTTLSNMSYVDTTALSNMAYIDQTTLNSMSYVDQTSLSSMGYMTQTDISSMSYITMTDVQGLGYIDQASLSAMSYVDNSYLGSYMNAVVGDINSILQTI